MIRLEEVRDGKYTMEQLVSQLMVEEMADLCVGGSRTSFETAGAYLDTCSLKSLVTTNC